MCSYTEKELREAVRLSDSISEVLRRLKLNVSGSAHSYIKRKIILLNISMEHFTRKKNVCSKIKILWQDRLVDKDIKCRVDGKVLTRCLIESGRKHCCEKCGLDSVWQNEKIILEVDHIDGNWKNNLPSNIRFLCPNCHSQTSNFYNKSSGKSKSFKRKSKHKCLSCDNLCLQISTYCIKCRPKRVSKIKPDKEVLENLIFQFPTTHIAERYGVSDKAVEKWCKSYGIQKPPRGYWSKKNS